MATGPIYTFVTFVTFQPCYIAASQSLIIALGRPTAVTGQLRRKQAPNLAGAAVIHRIHSKANKELEKSGIEIAKD